MQAHVLNSLLLWAACGFSCVKLHKEDVRSKQLWAALIHCGNAALTAFLPSQGSRPCVTLCRPDADWRRPHHTPRLALACCSRFAVSQRGAWNDAVSRGILKKRFVGPFAVTVTCSCCTFNPSLGLLAFPTLLSRERKVPLTHPPPDPSPFICLSLSLHSLHSLSWPLFISPSTPSHSLCLC